MRRNGYDTEVGQRGALLAAGQRQLVAFARAWLADPALSEDERPIRDSY